MMESEMMVASSTTEPLLRETEREAVTSLLRFMDQESQNDQHSMTEERLRHLCTLSYSENVELQRSSALCFYEISEKLVEPVTMEMLKPLIHLLLSPDIDVQKTSSLALSNLALHGPVDNKLVVVKAGALQPLVILLSSEDKEVQCNACGCITTLATLESNKVEIVKSGAIPPLLVLTSSSSTAQVKRNATGALLNLTHIENNRQRLVEAGAIAVFTRLLGSQDSEILFYSTAALSNLAVNVDHRREIMANGGGDKVLRHLISLMSGAIEKVQCQACLAVRNLASDSDNQQLIVRLGGLRALVPLLASGDVETVNAAVAALRNISICKGNEVPIVESGALHQLKKLVSFPNQIEIQCHSAGTIRNLAAEDQTMPIVESGCLDALAERLCELGTSPQTASDEMLTEVSGAIAILAGQPFVRKKIMALFDGNFYRTALSLTNSSYIEVQYNCAGIIGHLAIDEEYHSLLLEGRPSAMDYLSHFLLGREGKLCLIAVWTVSHFSAGSEKTKSLLRGSELMSRVAELSKGDETSDTTQLAQAAISNLKEMH